MPVKALFFGTDDLFNELKPFYEVAVQRGDIDIIGYANLEKDGIKLYPARGGVDPRHFEVAIISSRQNFYDRMKILERSGVPRNKIIDGRVFKVPNLNFQRLLTEGIAYGSIESSKWRLGSYCIYPQHYIIKNNSQIVTVGKKSYIEANAQIRGSGILEVGNFSSLSWDIIFNFLSLGDHNYHNVHTYPQTHSDWIFPREFFPPTGQCKILIGNDVWVGTNCILKSTNPNKPLIIGDGAVIASDSVVVKNVPPYAIVGGNPAQVIKYRFDEKIIESLLRIKWWDWDIDKIHDNFKYFNRVEKFVELHDA